MSKKKEVEITRKGNRDVRIYDCEDIPSVKQRIELLNEVKQLLIDGKTKTQILRYVESRVELKVNENIPQNIYEQATELVQRQVFELIDLPLMVHNHITTYEEMYEKSVQLGFLSGKLESMKKKEDLLGYHRMEKVVEIHQENNEYIDEKGKQVSIYREEKLNEKEKERLQQLLNKIKKDVK